MCRKRIETIFCVFKNEMLIFEKQIHDFLKKLGRYKKTYLERNYDQRIYEDLHVDGNTKP
jgi:hypothetical protein